MKINAYISTTLFLTVGFFSLNSMGAAGDSIYELECKTARKTTIVIGATLPHRSGIFLDKKIEVSNQKMEISGVTLTSFQIEKGPDNLPRRITASASGVKDSEFFNAWLTVPMSFDKKDKLYLSDKSATLRLENLTTGDKGDVKVKCQMTNRVGVEKLF